MFTDDPDVLLRGTRITLEPNGAFTAIVISESLLSVLSVIVFRRGRWEHKVA